MMRVSSLPSDQALTAEHIDDIKLAALKMGRIDRRSFQAEMAVKSCEGKPRRAEAVFGFNRDTVALGLHEPRTGIVCLNAKPALSGRLLWEDPHREVATVLWEVAEAHTQQDPSFRGALSYTRLTAAAALQALKERGFAMP